MNMKYCPQCGAKLKEKAKFCSECGSDLDFNNSKESVETLKEEVNKPENIQKEDKDKFHEIKKEKVNTPQKHFSTKHIIIALIVIIAVLLICVLVSNGGSKNNSNTSVNTYNSPNYDNMSKTDIENSIAEATTQSNYTLDAYYDDNGNPTIGFKVKNNTKYYINQVDLNVKINGETHSITAYNLSANSIDTVPISLDYTPDEGESMNYTVYVTDIDYE